MTSHPWKHIGRWLIPSLALAGSLTLFTVATLPAQEERSQPAAAAPAIGSEEVEGTFLTEEERNAAIEILKNRDRIMRILGPGQVFIYDPTRLEKPFRDPMVIPWTRYNRDLPQILQRIQNMMEVGRFDEAESELNNIKTNFPDNPYMDRIEQMLYQIRTRDRDATPSPTPTPRFPVRILDDTRAILYSETDPLVLIGESVLKPGDKVPASEDVTVKRIEPRRVIFEFKGVEYEKVIDALGD